MVVVGFSFIIDDDGDAGDLMRYLCVGDLVRFKQKAYKYEPDELFTKAARIDDDWVGVWVRESDGKKKNVEKCLSTEN